MSFEPVWKTDEEGADALMTQVMALILNPLGILRRRWIWMLLSLVLALGATTGIYLTAKPEYRAQATVLVSSQQISEEFVRSTVSGLDSLANINALVGEVISQQNLAALIEKYDLYSGLREKLDLARVIAAMREKITIEPQRAVEDRRRRSTETASIFLIRYESENPSAAASVANDLANGFINASIEKRSQQARTTTEFLRRELVRAEGDLREANAEISEFQRAHPGEMPGDQETLLRKLERLELRRQGLIDRIGAADERLVQLQNSEGIESNLKEVLGELRMELAMQLGMHTEEHPNVVALRSRIQQVESEVSAVSELLEQSSDSQEDLIPGAQRSLDSLRETFAVTVEEIRELDARASHIPNNAEALQVLNERATVLRETYLEFLRKVQDAQLAETLESAQQGPRVSLLDHAERPSEPVESPMRLLIIGLAASILLALTTGIGLELIDPVVLSPEHLERVGSPPLLGSIYTLS